jgi:hypothetical protein
MGFRDTEFRNSPLMRLQVLADLRSRGLLTEQLHWTDKRLAQSPRPVASVASSDV